MGRIDEGPMIDSQDVLQSYPLLPEHRIDERRGESMRILDNRDPIRKIMIMGPCSAWPDTAVIDYAEFAADLQDEVRDRVLILLRTYTQKPRTTTGWPGAMHQPDPLGTEDMDAGILYCRKMMCEAGKRLGLADEMLFTDNGPYFDDILSYLAIGARSTENTDHRNIASGLDLPIGIKNGTSGSIEIGINGVISAQAPHYFPHRGRKIRTTGNPYAHLILRGGGGRSNYDPESIAFADKLLRKNEIEGKIKNPAMFIDASHDNSLNGSGKDASLQESVIKSVLMNIEDGRSEYDLVKGFMVESFNKEGKQSEKGTMIDGNLGFDMSGLSITDACIGRERSRRIVMRFADAIDSRIKS